MVREACQPEPPLQASLLGRFDFLAEQAVEKVGVGGRFFFGSLKCRRELLSRSLELQVGRVRPSSLVGGVFAHRATPATFA